MKEPAIREHIWEMSIASVSFSCPVLSHSSLVGIKCNYVEQSKFLGVVNMSGLRGKYKTVQIKTLWYEMDYVSTDFEITLVNLEDDLADDEVTKEVTAFVQISYRRKT